ncbi:hypothetical protein R3P38DRAFT_3264765, partial [Favolaschia claudopus]
MPFSTSTTTSPTQTARSLARLHLKVPEGAQNNQFLVSSGLPSRSQARPADDGFSQSTWMHPRKAPRPAVGYRRVIDTSLAIGRRASPNNSACLTSPRATTDDSRTISTASLTTSKSTAAPNTAGMVFCKAAGTSSSTRGKSHLYETRRVATGLALAHSTSEPASTSSSSTPRPMKAKAEDTSSHRTDFGANRRHGVPVFADDIHVILGDVLRMETREEQDEKLLKEMLSGRVVGGGDRYKRVRMVPASGRVDASPEWMTTLF